MTNRSRLQLRSHVDPARRGEFIFAVLRDGEVVATIFGSREGLHIVSERFGSPRATSLSSFRRATCRPAT